MFEAFAIAMRQIKICRAEELRENSALLLQKNHHICHVLHRCDLNVDAEQNTTLQAMTTGLLS